jgi:uroporphyrinogen decarboxylase
MHVLGQLQLPELEFIFTQDWRIKTEEFIRAHQDRFLVISFGFRLFERSWALRGFEEALMDSAANPGFYDVLIERIAEHQMKIVERLLELPVDGIMFSDDWGYRKGMLLGPKNWRRFLKPRLQRMYKKVHEAGKMALSHCCGNIADVIPDIIEIGLDVLESVQPEAMNPYELKQKYGDRIKFWGGLGTQSVIQFGSPREIHDEVALLCGKMGTGGGYILAPAEPLQPGIPVENAAAVVDAFLLQADGVASRKE